MSSDIPLLSACYISGISKANPVRGAGVYEYIRRSSKDPLTTLVGEVKGVVVFRQENDPALFLAEKGKGYIDFEAERTFLWKFNDAKTSIILFAISCICCCTCLASIIICIALALLRSAAKDDSYAQFSKSMQKNAPPQTILQMQQLSTNPGNNSPSLSGMYIKAPTANYSQSPQGMYMQQSTVQPKEGDLQEKLL